MDQQLEEPDLRSYLGVIARRRWLVIATTLLFLGVAVAVSLIPEPQYRVSAQVLTTGVNDPVAMVFGANNTGDLNRQAASQAAYLRSSAMRFQVVSAYEGSLPKSDVFKVSVTPIESDNDQQTSSVVELSLVSPDPVGAATLVNVYAMTYVEQREAIDRERLSNTRQQLEALLVETTTQIDAIKAPVDELDRQISEPGGDDATLFAQRQAKLAELAPELEPLQAEATRIRGILGDVGLGVELAAGGGAEVLSIAGAPDTPVSPNLPLNLAIGLVFGLFLGAAAAFIRDYFDDSVKNKETIDRVTGVTTLGLIPKLDGATDLVTVTHPNAPAAEAFRLLRTSVKFLAVERQVRVV
ncbi:MAG TPA: Wzz/FepE/Etk N-terminal domain-containing protein, partial [Acidimicrobiales bacterium]|nr:Wzz/FepE/Etk N-terminal domain-containing protein [Acidimicrobiales bacterium]